jgi:hypothetical protein
MLVREVDVAWVKTDGNRKPDKDVVRQLVDSIKDVGLLNPITVTPEGKLRAGGHRLAAFKVLGWKKIAAHLQDLDDLKGELAQIDENLMRNPGTQLEQAEALKRRKEIYEALHPETKKGGDRKSNRQSGDLKKKAERFTKDTAAKTGVSERKVQRSVRLECGAVGASPGEVCIEPPHAGNIHRSPKGSFEVPLHKRLEPAEAPPEPPKRKRRMQIRDETGAGK